MKAILIDTNIVFDIALERREFYDKARELFEISFLNSVPAFVTASSVTDIYYLLKKKKGHLNTINFLKNFFLIIDIAGVDKDVISNALNSDMKDFEDAVQTETAKQNDIKIVITRNKKDFENSGLEIYSPEEYIKKINNKNEKDIV